MGKPSCFVRRNPPSPKKLQNSRPAHLSWDQENFNCRWAMVGAFGPPHEDVRFAVGEPTGIAGYLAGAQIGFNLQLGQGRVGFVIGAEVTASVSSLAAQLSGTICGCFDLNSEFRINYLTTATLRAGLAFGKVLLYGEGGLALANATWTNTLGFSDTVTDHGYVYGAGLEIALTHGISIFGEWNRIVIPEHRFIGTVTLLQLPTGIDVSSRTDIFKIGFNIHIGHDR